MKSLNNQRSNRPIFLSLLSILLICGRYFVFGLGLMGLETQSEQLAIVEPGVSSKLSAHHMQEAPTLSEVEHACPKEGVREAEQAERSKRRRFLELIKFEGARLISNRAQAFAESASAPVSEVTLIEHKKMREALGLISMEPRLSAQVDVAASDQNNFEFDCSSSSDLLSPIPGFPPQRALSLEEKRNVEAAYRLLWSEAAGADWQRLKRDLSKPDLFGGSHKALYRQKLRGRLAEVLRSARRGALVDYERIVARNPFLAYLVSPDPSASEVSQARQKYAEDLRQQRLKLLATNVDTPGAKVLALFGPAARRVAENHPEYCGVYQSLIAEIKSDREIELRFNNGVVVAGAVAGIPVCFAATVLNPGLGASCAYTLVAVESGSYGASALVNNQRAKIATPGGLYGDGSDPDSALTAHRYNNQSRADLTTALMAAVPASVLATGRVARSLYNAKTAVAAANTAEPKVVGAAGRSFALPPVELESLPAQKYFVPGAMRVDGLEATRELLVGENAPPAFRRVVGELQDRGIKFRQVSTMDENGQLSGPRSIQLVRKRDLSGSDRLYLDIPPHVLEWDDEMVAIALKDAREELDKLEGLGAGIRRLTRHDFDPQSRAWQTIANTRKRHGTDFYEDRRLKTIAITKDRSVKLNSNLLNARPETLEGKIHHEIVHDTTDRKVADYVAGRPTSQSVVARSMRFTAGKENLNIDGYTDWLRADEVEARLREIARSYSSETRAHLGRHIDVQEGLVGRMKEAIQRAKFEFQANGDTLVTMPDESFKVLFKGRPGLSTDARIEVVNNQLSRRLNDLKSHREWLRARAAR